MSNTCDIKFGFNLAIENASICKTSNDDGVGVINFATSKNYEVKTMMFLKCNIHKCAWKPPDAKTHNQIEYILIDR
jgi:hypothetical protein